MSPHLELKIWKSLRLEKRNSTLLPLQPQPDAFARVERIGDHTTNIAETIHYLVTGESLDINRPKLETTDITVEAVTGS